jgi:two-component sensor histidine kinase
MRRHLAAVAALGALLIAAGCSDDTAPTWTDGAAPTVGASAAPSATTRVALPANTQAVCDRAERAGATFGETFLADLKLQIDAAAKDEAAKAEVQRKISRDVQKYSSALASMAKQATDKTLKAALTQMSKEVKALKGDVTKVNADRMSNLTATLDKACGKA